MVDEGDAALVVTMLAVFLAGVCIGRLRASARPYADSMPGPTPPPEAPAPADATPAIGTRDAPPLAADGLGLRPGDTGPRSVSVQSPVTFKRWLAQPRFQPLPADGHGCWPE